MAAPRDSGPEVRNPEIGDSASALVRKMGSLVLLSGEEVQFLEGLQVNLVNFDAGQDLIEDGEEYPGTLIIRSGWAARTKTLSDGRRQILSFTLPGDFVGLHINFRRVAAYGVVAITDMEVAILEPNRILEVHQKYPILAAGLSWTTVREYNVLGEQAVRLGRRSALERMAHLILELWYRLKLIGAAHGTEISFPLTQAQMADTLGLSLVHINRTFLSLRKQGVISYDRRAIRLLDFDKLHKIADFESAYLTGFELAE